MARIEWVHAVGTDAVPIMKDIESIKRIENFLWVSN